VRLHDLLDGLDVELHDGPRGSDADVHSVVHDSRDVRPGALFACIRGATSDGHTYAPAAVEAGAVALLVEEPLALPVPQARVAHVRASLGAVAARFHGSPSGAMRVLGVTGTNGKTTTTYLLDAIARAAGDKTGIIGTVGTRIGEVSLPPGRTTPEATDLQALLARMRDAGVATVAMEVSSHALVQHRVDGTEFAACCFTNLTHDHLDFHDTMDAYFAAKARLFRPSFTTRAAISVDDSYGRTLRDQARSAGVEVWTFGTARPVDGGPAPDLLATDITISPRSTRFTLVSAPDARTATITTPLVGPFNVANALAAATTARTAGIAFDAVVRGLHDPVVVPGRLERVDAGQDFAVIVDYAHTPDALVRVLTAARRLASTAVVVVFGCGGDRDRAKRPLMGAAAQTFADRAFLTSDNPRSEDPAAIAEDVLAGVTDRSALVVELDRRLAIRAAIDGARPGDVVVIAGKGHETGQTASGVTVPFDDRVVARQELERLACS
jgi:UDP-N-acetylmuramoyl-L-alanyl-D-glutamate--2,6-diaminopimelate ligase